MYYINAIIVFTDTSMLKWINVMKVDISVFKLYYICDTFVYVYVLEYFHKHAF